MVKMSIVKKNKIINRKLITFAHRYLFKMYLKGRFVKYLILLSTWEWTNMLALCKCMYIFIIGNQLTTQNNDKYCQKPSQVLHLA